jgi:hypothetical protein
MNESFIERMSIGGVCPPIANGIQQPSAAPAEYLRYRPCSDQDCTITRFPEI